MYLCRMVHVFRSRTSLNTLSHQAAQGLIQQALADGFHLTEVSLFLRVCLSCFCSWVLWLLFAIPSIFPFFALLLLCLSRCSSTLLAMRTNTRTCCKLASQTSPSLCEPKQTVTSRLCQQLPFAPRSVVCSFLSYAVFSMCFPFTVLCSERKAFSSCFVLCLTSFPFLSFFSLFRSHFSRLLSPQVARDQELERWTYREERPDHVISRQTGCGYPHDAV